MGNFFKGKRVIRVLGDTVFSTRVTRFLEVISLDIHLAMNSFDMILEIPLGFLAVSAGGTLILHVGVLRGH